jgi:hypothetical protein
MDCKNFDQHLLVPIRIDALVVSSNDTRRWGEMAPNYGKLQGGDQEKLRKLPSEFTDSAKLLKPGIHLHFRLPAALTHWHQLGKADVEFPKIPNRWLVQRYFKTGAPSSKFQDRVWLIRSDANGPEAVLLPFFPDKAADIHKEPLQFFRAGSTVELFARDNPDFSGGPQDRGLTAATFGDPAFSAHYPSCRSVLGFHDAYDDRDKNSLPEGKLSYMVTGWYSDPSDDPWLRLTELSRTGRDTFDWVQIFKWFSERMMYPPKHLKNSEHPEYSGMLCHGWICDVEWKSERDYWKDTAFQHFPDSSKYTVSLGNNLAEAISARVNTCPVDRALWEDMLTGLQTGLVAQDLPLPEIDAELHRMGFEPVRAPRRWSLKLANSTGVKKDQPSPEFPNEVPEQLAKLNELDSKRCRIQRQYQAYRAELYAIWRRLTVSSDAGLKESYDELKSFLTEFSQLQAVKESRRDTSKAIRSIRRVLATFGHQKNGVHYRLVSADGDPFYSPNEPVMMVSGPALERIGTTESGMVRCRWDWEVRDEVQDGGVEPVLAKHYDKEHLGFLCSHAPWAYWLLSEKCLLDEQGDTKRRAGVGIFDWGNHNPWIPQYLVWQAEWEPDYAPGSLSKMAKMIEDRWKLDSAEMNPDPLRRRSDLVPRNSPKSSGNGSVTITGYTILAEPVINTGVAAGLASDELKEAIRKLNAATDLQRTKAQTLGGMREAWIMQHLGDQLPPLRFATDNKWYLDEIYDNFKEWSPDRSPDLDKRFLPIRAGRLKIPSFYVVDAFGQAVHIEIGTGKAAINKALRMSQDKTPPDEFFRLPPRFAQPMRLNFKVEPDPNTHYALRGWIAGNRFDSLTVHDAYGALLGAIQGRLSLKKEWNFYWMNSPGTVAGIPAKPVSKVDEKMVPDDNLCAFVNFVLGLHAPETNEFIKLLRSGIEATEVRSPSPDAVATLFIGKPLAIVCASLAFETPGVPALHQKDSWTRGSDTLRKTLVRTLEHPTPGIGRPLLNAGGFETVNWPILLGDAATPSDGLIGYFVGEPKSHQAFYAARGLRSEPDGSKLKSQQTLKLNCGAGETRVTLLMDPFAKVHATSGVLPRGVLQLPEAELARVRQPNETFFQVAPVLGSDSMPQIPRPADDYGDWKWVRRQFDSEGGTAQWKEKSNLIPATDQERDSVEWPTISEGWLKLKIAPVRILSFSNQSTDERPKAGAEAVIGWSVRGDAKVKLFEVAGENCTEIPLHDDARYRWTMKEDSSFELQASDEHGNSDRRRLTVEVGR